MTEWANYLKLFNSGAARKELLAAARNMKNADNQKVALMNLGILTKSERDEIESRWASINAVTEKEISAHCQFDGFFGK